MLCRDKPLFRYAALHPGKFFLLGLFAVSLYQLHRWKQDKRFSKRSLHPDFLPPIDSWLNQPKVSVLVAAWNESALIEQHMHSFLSLRYPNKELIICAGGEDGTYFLAKQRAADEVIVLRQGTDQGKQGALRSCFLECTGEIIYLTDADCLLDDKSFERIIFPIACEMENACSGGSIPLGDSLRDPLVAIQAASDFVQYTDPDGPQYYPGLFGRNCALSRQLVDEFGGFSREAPSGTDYLLAKQISCERIPIKQIRNSLVRSDYPETPKAYIRQKRRWHRNVIFYSLKFRNHSELFQSVTLSMVSLLMLFFPLLFPFLGLPTISLWLTILLFGFLSRKRYLHVWRTTKSSHAYVSSGMVLYSLFLDFIGWSLAFVDIFSPQRRTSW